MTEAHKALNGQEKFKEEKTELDRLTGEVQELLAAKPNHPSGSAQAPLLEKNKALVEKSRFESRRAYNSETESKRSGCFIERRQASSLF